MREVFAKLGEDIRLGRRGENLATRVTFDVSGWMSSGDGTIHLLHQRNGDNVPYPCAITVDGGTVTWEITAADVEMAGRGRAELQYLDGDVCKKSAIYTTNTLRALNKAGKVPPEPEEGWVRQVLEASAAANGAASRAAAAAEHADAALDKQPMIVNGTWYVWDAEAETYVDTGEKAQGPQGVSGVYVGGGEMPDGYNVQVDPDGEASGPESGDKNKLLYVNTNGDFAMLRLGPGLKIESGVLVALEDAIGASAGQTEITPSAYPGYDTLISESNGNWSKGTDRITYFVPVGNAEQIDITAGDAGSVIALMKTTICANGTAPDYATGGYRMFLQPGTTANLPVPNDCKYIAIMGAVKGVDYTPASVVFHTPAKAISTPPIGLHTMPENKGVLNCIKRCRQMTDIKWTPLLDIPRWSWQTGGRLANGHCDDREDVFKAGVEYTGLPYARAGGSKDWDASAYGYTNFFTGFNVPFSAFVTAVREKNSVMKESAFDLTSKSACMFGVVCSTLACYAYGLKSYRATSTLQDVSGMEKIGDLITGGVRMDASLIKLGDMILESGNHVGVITDIVTDARGDVIAIEVSEATTAGNGNLARQGTQFGGLCRRKGWPVDEFFSWWKNYSIYRYSTIAGVTYNPSPYVNVGDELNMMPQIDYACLPYMGEGFKYKVGKIPNSTIVIGVEGFTHLRVMKDGEYFGEPIAINGETYVDAGFTEAGEYSAYLCNMDGDTETKTTGACHWTVV